MIARFLTLGCAALLMASPVGTLSPAFAQLEPYTPTGSRVARKPESVDPKLARRMQKDFGECVYRRHPELAENLLRSSDPNNVDYALLGISERDLSDEFSMGECLGRAMTANQIQTVMTIKTTTLRSLLAEESYLERHEAPLTLPEGSEEFLSARFMVAAPDLRNSEALAAFSDCVVFHSPAEADRVLRTWPATDEEDSAVRAMVPALSACLVEGQELELTAASIRAIVADGLWARSYYSVNTETEAAE